MAELARVATPPDLNGLYERAHTARLAMQHQRANSLDLIELGGRAAMALHDENETSTERTIRIRCWLARTGR